MRIHLREQDQILLAQTFKKEGALSTSIKFNSDPTRNYGATLTSEEQISKGLDLGGGKYGFAVVLPFAPTNDLTRQFQTGFSGRAIFEIGRRPLAYVFFRDFVHFLRMQF